MSTVTSAHEPDPPTAKPPRRGCLFTIWRVFKWLIIILVVLVILGVAYQTVASEQDKRNYYPRGEFYTVNGHQIHMICTGEGSPTVILQAGLSAESLWWHWVQTQLEQHTRVCAYDRPGMGWSEPTGGTRDALTIINELHSLLEEAAITVPYVMAGHSYGAIWTRIYAAQYPEAVAGIVLVDSGLVIPRQFASQGEFDGWKSSNDAIQAVLWAASRTGLLRLTGNSDFSRWGYPPEIVPEMAALRGRNQTFDTTYAEQVPAMMALTEASAGAENLGDLPISILWASATNTMMELVPALRERYEEFPTYSTNTVTHIVEGADHGSILGNEQYAWQVTDAILGVIEAVGSGEQ